MAMRPRRVSPECAQRTGHRIFFKSRMCPAHLPTPKSATMKKCVTSTEGRGLRPDSSDTGPAAGRKGEKVDGPGMLLREHAGQCWSKEGGRVQAGGRS